MEWGRILDIRMRKWHAVAAGVALAAMVSVEGATAQIPLGYVAARGQTVTPAYEGWYMNADGTKTLSFGYYNRNREEVLEIPFGPDNFISPAELDGVQPTRFEVIRHWGAFGVVVPGDFRGPVSWTLTNRGHTYMIPVNLTPEWNIDALRGEASGNHAPDLATSASGPWAAGPLGLQMDPVQTTAWTATELTVFAKDDGMAGGSSTAPRVAPITLTWFKHSGPGDVEFSETSAQLEPAGGSMTTKATFSEPGVYVVRVRANDSSGVTGAGHSQCCWSNGFVRVVVN